MRKICKKIDFRNCFLLKYGRWKFRWWDFYLLMLLLVKEFGWVFCVLREIMLKDVRGVEFGCVEIMFWKCVMFYECMWLYLE